MQSGQKSMLVCPIMVYQSSLPLTGSGLGQAGNPFLARTAISFLVCEDSAKECCRAAAGRLRLGNACASVGLRLIPGAAEETLFNEGRSGFTGDCAGLLEDGREVFGTFSLTCV